MRVLVTFAVEAEFAPWRKLRNLTTRETAGHVVSEAKIGRADVDFVVTGMGMENAKRVTEAVITPDHKACIGAGFAGALKPTLKVGDVLVARAVRVLGKSKTLECSRNLFMAAYENQAIEAKMFLTTDHVIGTTDERKRLSPFAEAVDMESYTILAEAARCGVPAVAIRAISDTADFDMPYDFERARDAHGQIRAMGVFSQVLRRPGGLPSLLKLSRDTRFAARRLADFLDAFAGTMADRLAPIEQDAVAAL